MRLLSFVGDDGALRPGVLAGDLVIDLHASDPRLPADMCALLAGGDDMLRRAGALKPGQPGIRALPLDAVVLGPPVPRPEKILGVGLNYRDHCREMQRELPQELRVFAMFANGLIGSGGQISLPRNSSQMDYEAELVAVIGRPARYVPDGKGLDHVAGYMVGNDISARDHQNADPLTMRGKCGDTHAPTGPWIVTADELRDPSSLGIELRLNGAVMQSSSTAELVFDVGRIVSFLSNYYTLRPGDLIFTGTPAGVGAGRKPPVWLQPGDRIEVEIEGIGRLWNTCVAEG